MIDCISLFSGAGGLDLGAEMAGVKLIRCVEFDADAVQTLRLNFRTGLRIDQADIATLSFHEHRDTGKAKIVIGGPPCQPFSKNGYWVRNENRRVARDPRNMLTEFLRAVSEAEPAGFLFENVESLLHPTNKDALRGFLSIAESMGYRCTLYRANAVDFGVPQKRKRVFVFGVRKNGVHIPLPKPTHSATPDEDGLEPHEGVGRWISGFDHPRFFEPGEITSGGTYERELTHVPPGKNYIALSKLPDYHGRKFKPGSRFWNFLHKLHPSEPSITVAAQPGPWVGPFHWNNRRLRAPEAAAIQTFPREYKFVGTRRSIQKQIGNAVPPVLGRAMVKHLLEHL